MLGNNKVESIRCFFPKTKESIESLSQKTLHFLNTLKQIDKELFSIWYEQGWSKKQAQEKIVLFDANYLARVIEKEWDKKFPELGSSFSFWSGKDNDIENVKINFSLGKTTTNQNLQNVVSVTFPKKNELHIPRT